MNVFTFAKAAALGVAMAVTGANASFAATVNEGSFAGDFSSNYASPTAIATGVTTINGTLGSGDSDFLSFTGMQAGAQTVTLNVAASGAGPLWIGSILYSTTPFTSNSSGTLGGTMVMYNFPPLFVSLTQSLSFNLGATFGGTLFLALNQQMGSGFSYSLGVPGNVSGVPLPAPILLLGGAVAALGASRRRGKRAAA